ncbi:MAG: beta-lactamase class [Acidimicrobiaceae bacterium]
MACALLVPACGDDRVAPPGVVSSASMSSSSAPLATATLPVDPEELAARLQATVDAFVAGQHVPFSVVVVDLSTGARATHLSDRQVPSASLYKLFVARELLRRIQAGTLERDAAAGDGSGRTVDECLRAMIVVSDNACGVAGLTIVGRGAQNSSLRRDGYLATSLAAPQQTSADDVALFFERAREGTLLGPGSDALSAELYQLLREQQVNDRLPLGLPTGTQIAHKTGDIRQWAHDAGVITTSRGDVLLAVLSGPWALPCCDADHPGEAERVAFGAIAELGTAIYDAAST